jgi:hypothetical protein
MTAETAACMRSSSCHRSAENGQAEQQRDRNVGPAPVPSRLRLLLVMAHFRQRARMGWQASEAAFPIGDGARQIVRFLAQLPTKMIDMTRPGIEQDRQIVERSSLFTEFQPRAEFAFVAQRRRRAPMPDTATNPFDDHTYRSETAQGS